MIAFQLLHLCLPFLLLWVSIFFVISFVLRFEFHGMLWTKNIFLCEPNFTTLPKMHLRLRVNQTTRDYCKLLGFRNLCHIYNYINCIVLIKDFVAFFDNLKSLGQCNLDFIRDEVNSKKLFVNLWKKYLNKLALNKNTSTLNRKISQSHIHSLEGVILLSLEAYNPLHLLLKTLILHLQILSL